MIELAGGELARDLRANRPGVDQLHGIEADRQTNRSTAIAVDGHIVAPTRVRVIVVYEELAGGPGVTDSVPRHTVYRAVPLPRCAGRAGGARDDLRPQPAQAGRDLRPRAGAPGTMAAR